MRRCPDNDVFAGDGVSAGEGEWLYHEFRFNYAYTNGTGAPYSAYADFVTAPAPRSAAPPPRESR